jgi:Protein of unknown function (DUF3617)
MMKGKSKSERKCISSELATTGVAVLLAPDPKAQCHTDVQQIAGGRYGQALTCPQKQGPPISITRTGTYNASGFAGRLDMGGQTPKGAMRITLDQKATHGAGRCQAEPPPGHWKSDPVSRNEISGISTVLP